MNKGDASVKRRIMGVKKSVSRKDVKYSSRDVSADIIGQTDPQSADQRPML